MKDEKIIVQKKKLSEMTDAEIDVAKYRALERRYNSVMEAVTRLENQNDLFRGEISAAAQRCINAQTNVEINKMIVQNTIMDSNAKLQSYLGEIADLKAELKESKEAQG